MIPTHFFRSLAPKLAAFSIAAASIAAMGVASGALAQGGGQSTVILDTFNDWGAYSANAEGSKICYALSQPIERRPDTLRRGPGMIFVSYGSSQSAEISFVLGFPAQDEQEARGVVDGAPFTFTTLGENAFVADPEDTSQIVDAFVRGRQFELNVTSARGNATTDVYSLSGFTAAMRRAQQECS